VRKIFQNKVIGFVATRYFSYVLQFLNSLVVAWSLGPFYLGVWGFISMVLQYMAFGNFGVDISLNVNLSTGKFDDVERQRKYASNAFISTAFTSLLYLIVASFLVLGDVAIFEKFLFTRYLFLLVVISCLNYFNVLFLNIFRAHSLFKPISLFQTIVQLIQLPMFLFFKDTELINAILIAQFGAHLISFGVFYMNMPFSLKFQLDLGIIKVLFSRGVSLLVYNITFYLIMLTTRSLVSYYYPVEVMGLFTFAANIATALIVGLSSLDFVLFPKMLNRLGQEDINPQTKQSFNELRYLYTTLAFLVVFIGIISYPVLLLYFREYQSTVIIFSLLAISQLVISSGFGYATLIISKGREWFLVKHGLIAILINLLVGGFMVNQFESHYEALGIVLILSFVYYDINVVRLGRKLLHLDDSIKDVLGEMFPIPTFLSIVIFGLGVYLKLEMYFNPIALLVFLMMNKKGYTLIRKYLSLLLNKPSSVNIAGD